MSEYNEQVMKLFNVIKDKEFLFPKHMPQKMSFGLYFDYFESRNKMLFNQMPTMVHFSSNILDKYKDKIVWTGFQPTDVRSSAYAIHSLIQINPHTHVIFVFAQEDDEISVIGTLYLTDGRDYMKFMDENEKYVIRSNKSVGFNLSPGFSFQTPTKNGDKNEK